MKERLQRAVVPFTQIPNELLQSGDLSLKAMGLFAHMASRPEGWNFTLRSMSKSLKDGRAGITSALDELKETGWIIYEKHHDGSGTYWLQNEPNSENRTKAQIQKIPPSENPIFRKPERTINKDSLQIKSYYKKRVEEIKIDEIENAADRKYFEIALMWWKLFRKNRKDSGAPTSDLDKATWKNFVDPIRLMMERDNVTVQQFRIAYDFLKISDFWKGNIFSTNKLRKQISTLITQSKNHGAAKNGTSDDGQQQRINDYTRQVIQESFGSQSN
jgi:hypothetical protein